MTAGYLTKEMYSESLRNLVHQAIREELMEIDKEIVEVADLDALQPSQVPPAGLYASQHWSRVWEYPWAIEALLSPIAPPLGIPDGYEGQRILDVGPGLSPLPIYLARHGAEVTCIDTHPVFPDIPGARRLRMVKTDIRDWESNEEFDAILCISVLEHIPNVDMVSLFLRWMYGDEGPKRLGKLLVTLDIPLGPTPYGVPLPAFADLLAWLCQWYGTQGCPRYPGYDKMLNSSDFGRQGEIVGKEIGIFYLALGG